jgi:hypothetical protein
MAQSTTERNPFMLMLHPELVLAAIEKSERLQQLNRHLCRPLDKPLPGSAAAGGEAVTDEDVDDIVRGGQELAT